MKVRRDKEGQSILWAFRKWIIWAGNLHQSCNSDVSLAYGWLVISRLGGIWWVHASLKFTFDMILYLKTVSLKVSVASSKPLSKLVCFSLTHLLTTCNPHFWLKNRM